MVNYNTDGASKGFDQFKRRSTNREVDPSSAPKFNKSPLDDDTSSGFDQFKRRQTNQGLGSPTNQTNKRDDDDDKDVGGFSGFLNKFFGAAEASGLEFTKPNRKPKPSIYNRDDMKPIDFDAMDKRIADAVNFDLAKPMPSMNFKDDEYAQSTYDEVQPLEGADTYKARRITAQGINDTIKGLMDTEKRQTDIKQAVNKTIESLKSADDNVPYVIQAGDTLSDIAAKTGTTVQDLVKRNNIKDKNKIYTGNELIIPTDKTTKSKEEVVNNLVESYELRITTRGDNLDPDSDFYQSGISPTDRTYAEGDFLDNNPQTRQGLMLPQGQQNQPNAVIIEAQQALTDLGYRPMGIDGKAGPGTERALRKFQKASGLPITGKLDNETITQLAASSAPNYFDPPLSASETKKILDSESESGSIIETFSSSDFDKFAAAVADKESSNRYNIHGGATHNGKKKILGGIPQYDGKYQLGKGAKADVSAVLTDPKEKAKLVHTTKIGDSRKAFVKDKALQEKAFKIYTQKNHEHLTRYSKAYRDMSDKDKLAVLGYAHNQGATAAEEWLYTGVSGSDAFGTLGDEYTTKIQNTIGERDTPN